MNTMPPPGSVHDLAPVVMFVFARPDHTRRALESLCANDLAPRTHLTVFADGPRNAADVDKVAATRNLVRGIRGLASVRLVERATNLGLASNVIAGVSEMCDRHGRVIVLEDDLVLSPYFLRFMNDALDCYADDERVASVHGYCYPTGERLDDTFFLRGADCWGWATWARAWRHFEPDGARLLDTLRRSGLAKEFDLGGAFPYMKMLEDQTVGRNNSWAIRWHASCYLADMLTLYPGSSLVENIGNDSSGTHSATTEAFSKTVASEPVNLKRIALSPSAPARRAFADFLRRQRRAARFHSLLRRFGLLPR
jgi:hypothetical protein